MTGRNVGRQIQKYIQISLSITGVIHSVLQILFHFEATPCSVGFPAPTWCFTFPVLCTAAFRGTGFQALGTSVETEIAADAIAKPPGSAEIIPHPRPSLCSSLAAAAQPPKSWFPTGMLHLGLISAESTCDSILGLWIRERVMARCQPGSGRAVYLSGWNHGMRKQEAGTYLVCQVK